MVPLVIGNDTRVAGYRSGVEIKEMPTGTPSMYENDGRAGMAVGFILQFDAISGGYAANWKGCNVGGSITCFGRGNITSGLLLLLFSDRLHYSIDK